MKDENKILKIGITGQEGFIGTHLYNTLGLYPDRLCRVMFKKSYFDNDSLLDLFVTQCDVIIHLAGINRHPDTEQLYHGNISLTEKIIDSLKRCNSSAHIIFSSSIKENEDNPYGRSKNKARQLFDIWAKSSNGNFTGLLIPNVLGVFGVPFDNSVIATFCHQLAKGQEPVIQIDNELQLIYVDDLVSEILSVITLQKYAPAYYVKATVSISVSKVLELLKNFRDVYIVKGIIPSMQNRFILNLFNTFRSFLDLEKRYPVNLILHTDSRGDFTEIIRLGQGVSGQVSFSTTFPGITRGNHFHIRKIERFAVISGEAKIQMRRVGAEQVFEFTLSGKRPSYVDIPIWTIHNITNIGTEPLCTIFWINEPYFAEDSDTYFERI